MTRFACLLEVDKNQIHVLGLSETKLNDIHPDSAFQVNIFQKPFRQDREANSGGILVYVKDGISCSRRPEHRNIECIWLEIKQSNLKLSKSRVNLFFYVKFTDHHIQLFNGTQSLKSVWKMY